MGRSTQTYRLRHTAGQKAHEKMFNIANYQRTANQNYNEMSPHTSQNGHHQKSTNNKCQRGCGEKGTLLQRWWRCKLVQPLWRTVQRHPQKVKTELPHDPAIPLLGMYILGGNSNWKSYMHPNVHRGTIYNSQDMEAT